MVSVGVLVLTSGLIAQAAEPGQKTFETYCSRCHGADGNGGEMGPPIASRLAPRDDAQLDEVHPRWVAGEGDAADAGARWGDARSGEVPPDDSAACGGRSGRSCIACRRDTAGGVARRRDRRPGLRRPAAAHGRPSRTPPETGRRRVFARSPRASTGRPTTATPRGNRYTSMTQIDKCERQPAGRGLDVHARAPVSCRSRRWSSAASCTSPDRTSVTRSMPAAAGKSGTTSARSTAGLSTGGHANRGVAVAGDSVFMETDNAHIIALNRITGELVWDTELADWHKNYSASSAPLASRQPDHLRGRPAASMARTGSSPRTIRTRAKRSGASRRSRSRANRDPNPGRARTSSTAARRPGSPAATIRDLDLVYWPTGNPSKEYNGDHRKGDNLYSDSHPRARSEDRAR